MGDSLIFHIVGKSKIKQNLKLIVIQAKNDTLKLSKPCKNCLKLILKTGISKVIYSTGNIKDPIHYEKTKKIKTNHVSKIFRDD